jgi:hypothetical protein
VWAGTGDFTLEQRLFERFVLSANYRIHRQRGVSFFTILARPSDPLRTADSDLETLVAQTVGGRATYEMTFDGSRRAHVDLGYDRYFRDNDLTIDVFTCGIGVDF